MKNTIKHNTNTWPAIKMMAKDLFRKNSNLKEIDSRPRIQDRERNSMSLTSKKKISKTKEPSSNYNKNCNKSL